MCRSQPVRVSVVWFGLEGTRGVYTCTDNMLKGIGCAEIVTIIPSRQKFMKATTKLVMAHSSDWKQ